MVHGQRREARQRPRIVFVINSIGSGGAERALDTILRAAAGDGRRYDIRLVLLDREPEMRELPVLDGRYCLDARGRLVASAWRLRRLLRDLAPDLVVSLLVRANMANVLAGAGAAWATIVCERMHLGSHLAGRYRGVRLAGLRLLPRLLYPRATQVLAVSEGVRQDLVTGFGVPAGRIATINNPYDLDRIVADGGLPPSIVLPPAFLVAVGRLVAAKGFADLVEAYRRAMPPVPLFILGEGSERQAIERQVASAGLADRILLPGYLPDPFAVVARADALISASHNEGFPNAIAEAMVLARPVLATDCPSGPAELLEGATPAHMGEVTQARHGLLVRDGDIDGLAAGLVLLADPDLRARYGARGRARMQDFRVEDIARQYWDRFDAVLGRSGGGG